MPEQYKRLTEPCRDGLLRSVPFEFRSETSNSDGLTLDGYALVFNTETEINSWEGRFKEKIARGATKKSISETTPRLQFDHGHHPLIGSIPIGKISSLQEDSRGLHVEARLTDNWLMQPVRDAIAQESIDGMSFRFSVVREQWHDSSGKEIKDKEQLLDILWSSYSAESEDLLTRTLREVKIPELGPVVWPAYEETSVGVRNSVTIDLGNLADPAQRNNLASVIYLADAASVNNKKNDKPIDNLEDAETHLVSDVESSRESQNSTPVDHLSVDSETLARKAKLRKNATYYKSYALSIDKE